MSPGKDGVAPGRSCAERPEGLGSASSRHRVLGPQTTAGCGLLCGSGAPPAPSPGHPGLTGATSSAPQVRPTRWRDPCQHSVKHAPLPTSPVQSIAGGSTQERPETRQAVGLPATTWGQGEPGPCREPLCQGRERRCQRRSQTPGEEGGGGGEQESANWRSSAPAPPVKMARRCEETPFLAPLPEPPQERTASHSHAHVWQVRTRKTRSKRGQTDDAGRGVGGHAERGVLTV